MNIPDFVRTVLQTFEAEPKPMMEAEVFDMLVAARKKHEPLTDEDFEGFRAEVSAFSFYPRRDEDSVWGTYFAPTFTAKRPDGTEFRSPDITELNSDIVSHWEQRAKVTPHPVLKARYADLVWDLKKAITGITADIGFARLAIDAYLDAAEKGLYTIEIEGIQWIQRALDLALKINDKERRETLVDFYFEFYDRIARSNLIGTWTFLFDDLYARKHLVSPEYEASIVEMLEKVLAISSNAADKEHFDPWAAEAAAERLARHFQRLNNQHEIQRVIGSYGKAFEQAARDAGSMLAMAWLQPVYEKYQQTGMKEDAERVQRASLEKAENVQSEMKTLSVPVEIERDKIESFLEELTSDKLESSLFRISVYFTPNVDKARRSLEEIKKIAPLQALIGIKKIADGHFVASVGSVDDDQEGRLYIQLAQDIQIRQIFLVMTLDRVKNKYSPTVDQIMAFLAQSPAFQDARESMLKEGLAAYLNGDYLKAIHVLVPQVEHTLRNVLALLGIPTNKQRRGWSGVMQAKNLNDILGDLRMRSALGESLWRYLDVFLADPRGHNLRNRIAHGLVDAAEFQRPLADQVFHVLLTLSLIRKSEAAEESG